MKKLVSLLMAVILLVAVTVSASAYTVWHNDVNHSAYAEQLVSAAEAIANYEASAGTTVATNRYYFLMPNGSNGMRGTNGKCAPSWYNQYTRGAGVYWWGAVPAACSAWAGYQAMVDDADECIYYADVPKKATAFIWNNGIDGTKDPTFPLYTSAAQTINVPCEFPDPDEYDTMPEGADSFDGCIWVINPDEVSIHPESGVPTCGGTWYFYYGSGCYGIYATTSENFVDVETNCCNPDHDHSAPALVRGDYDNDGEVTISDVTYLQRMLAGLEPMYVPDLLKALDPNNDDDTEITDATYIQRYLVGLVAIDGQFAEV